MKKLLLTTVLAFTLLLTACGSNTAKPEDDGKIKVVSSFTIITDMAQQIGGDLVDVYNLVPTGTDPHEYEPKPDDIKAATDADVLFFNGMNLEGGETGWFAKMIDSVNQNKDHVFDLNEGVTPKYLVGDTGRDEEVNPHSFLDPKVGIKMAENLKDALIKIDGDNKEVYKKNAEAYLTRLNEIDAKYTDVISALPEERRILVTSERAFQYMTESYGLREAYVWEIDTEELGTTEQIKTLIDTLKKENPPVLFMESNVDPKPLETVSNESGIKIFEEHIYSDEIGKKGDQVDTYVKLLEHNIRIIETGLKS
ncbi:metal ABC transporter solute-binding protein, Zn/Mn family [Erysipelothrix urinaevulpis]|uniref:metal ABC transporter substrate-binding protein n=1 Tax=Erysipelothrix urinaevulpis TaxID=2683717 RepID=UPI00135CAD98|nr:zinc ABC transporter substrate-binding protein [Erysipelothrix urinaevulpis]